MVKNGRGDRLIDDESYFQAHLVGAGIYQTWLVDELASASQVARDVIGAEDIVDYTKRENYLDRFAKQMGSAMLHSLTDSIRLQ